MKPTKKRYKTILAVIMILLLLTFSGCTHKGNFSVYYKDEFIGNSTEYRMFDGDVCFLSKTRSETRSDYEIWVCYNKKYIDILTE